VALNWSTRLKTPNRRPSEERIKRGKKKEGEERETSRKNQVSNREKNFGCEPESCGPDVEAGESEEDDRKRGEWKAERTYCRNFNQKKGVRTMGEKKGKKIGRRGEAPKGV